MSCALTILHLILVSVFKADALFPVYFIACCLHSFIAFDKGADICGGKEGLITMIVQEISILVHVSEYITPSNLVISSNEYLAFTGLCNCIQNLDPYFI